MTAERTSLPELRCSGPDLTEGEKQHGLVNHMISIALTPEQVARFSELWQQCSDKDVNDRAPCPPARILVAMEKLITHTMSKGMSLTSGVQPDWLAAMVDHRDEFLLVQVFC